MTQLVKHPTLGFGSGHDPIVGEFAFPIGLCADSVEPAWDSLSLPLSPPLPPSLFLSINKLKTEKKFAPGGVKL